MSKPVRVDVWSDVQCIWCYISSARLRTAIQQHPGPVDVTYHSFQLTPDAPLEIDREEQIRKHGGNSARMQQIMTQLHPCRVPAVFADLLLAVKEARPV